MTISGFLQIIYALGFDKKSKAMITYFPSMWSHVSDHLLLDVIRKGKCRRQNKQK